MEPFEWQLTESLHRVLQQAANPDGVWLWCLFCERFFQARHLRIDHRGKRQGCAFCGCAGFDHALFKWDTFRDGSWPESASQLRHGLRLQQPRED